MTKYRIPVRVVTPPVTLRRNTATAEEPTDVRTQTGETASTAVSSTAAPGPLDNAAWALKSAAEQAVRQAAQEAVQEEVQNTAPADVTQERELSYRLSESEEWKERALRLQADMASYRERQKRIAHEQAQAEQIALLKDVLAVADNLDRALAAAQEKPGRRDESGPLTRGVEMTRVALQRTLAQYGLEQFQAEGKPFDPAWHEAVHVVPANVFGARPGTVVQVLEDGYRRRGVLFRPAKVVVAQ
jgi:molecular chaperone GrpE